MQSGHLQSKDIKNILMLRVCTHLNLHNLPIFIILFSSDNLTGISNRYYLFGNGDFFLSPNRHDKTPSYTRGRHILLIEKERTSYDTVEVVWQPHPCIE